MKFDKAMRAKIVALAAICLAAPPSAGAQTYPERVYWGDTHLHTNYSSLDASDSGRMNLGPDTAYRIARGEVVEDNAGAPVRLSRPLDFLVVADHSEFMGLWEAVKSADRALMSTSWGRRWRQEYRNARSAEDYEALDTEMLTPDVSLEDRTSPALTDVRFRRSIWRNVGRIADRYNDPGTFTAFIGFEWSATPNWANLHRVVIFRDDSRRTNQVLPLSSTDTVNPEDLWTYLRDYEQRTGGQVLAAPHNPNLSSGQMFNGRRFDGSPIDAEYAATRARWEPVLEVTQMKGDSETHPVLSPNDEFADFETWNSWFGRRAPPQWTPEAIEQRRGDYARSALLRGLQIQTLIGVNPYRLGLIGGTDAHNALPLAEEDNFWGKFYTNAPSPDRMTRPGLSTYKMTSPWTTAELSASGYTGVWATENTRAAIFDAMRRREVYATTGPRIELRFFGGWTYSAADAQRADFAQIGYANGVPMGGELSTPPAHGAPTFLIRAVRDPIGANLDRVQVIKGWVDSEGQTHERVYNVALSDGRRVDRNGDAPPVGSTVDLASATYANSIGDPELAVVWRDPDFNPQETAFYYVRVLQIPTPRWTAYDASRYNVPHPENIPSTIQERAYSSPIWYTPAR
jgi:hypothetical protein